MSEYNSVQHMDDNTKQQAGRQAPSLNSLTANPATMRITCRSNNEWLNSADHTGAVGLLDRTRAKSADTSV